MTSPVGLAAAAMVQLAVLPFVCAMVSLMSDRVGRWTRWLAPAGCGAAGLLGLRAMLHSESYLRIRPSQPLFGRVDASSWVIYLFDWASVLIIGLCVLSICICFARSRGAPHRDASLLIGMGLVCSAAVAGCVPVIAIVLIMATLPFFGLFSGGLGPPPPGVVRDSWGHSWWELKAALGARWFALVGIGCAWWVAEAFAHPSVFGGRDDSWLRDLACFPGGTLTQMSESVTGLTLALATLCGAWPLGFVLSRSWSVLGARAGAGGLFVGPAALGLALWLRLTVQSHEAVVAGLPLGGRRGLLLALAAMGIASGIVAMAAARDRDRLRQVLCVSQISYLLAALVLASSGAAHAIYAYPALAMNLALSGGGLALADRLERTELRGPLAAVCYAALAGCPPFGGFVGRFALLGAVAEELGSRWWWIALALWVGEVCALAFAGWRVARSQPAARPARLAEDAPKPRREAWARASETAWAAGLLALQLWIGPLAILMGDLLARQIVTGQA